MQGVLAPAGAQHLVHLPVRQRPAQPQAGSVQLARHPSHNLARWPLASVCTCSTSQRRSSGSSTSSSCGTPTSSSSTSTSGSSHSSSSSSSSSSHTGVWLPHPGQHRQQPQLQRRRALQVPRAALAGSLGGAYPPQDDASSAAATSTAAAAAGPQGQQADPPAPSLPPSATPRSVAPTRPRFQLWSLGAPLAWGFMLGYIGLMLVLPITAMLTKASSIPLDVFIARATEPVALSAYFVSFSVALAAALINAVFGFVLAWVLVKFKFPGKKWVDAAVDLPFALPTSVAGLTLATVYSDEGLLGAALMAAGIDVVFTRLGVAVAMVFVSFPFVVRTMQPVLQEMEKEVEEAAYSLGASPWTTFTQVLLPPLLPPLLTGTALAFSRALGEFGSVVIVSSNFPFKDLIAPVLIFQCLEQYDFVGATVIGTVLLMISLVMMVGVNWLQSYAQRFRK